LRVKVAVPSKDAVDDTGEGVQLGALLFIIAFDNLAEQSCCPRRKRLDAMASVTKQNCSIVLS
jgi:hypothetical protein